MGYIFKRLGSVIYKKIMTIKSCTSDLPGVIVLDTEFDNEQDDSNKVKVYFGDKEPADGKPLIPDPKKYGNIWGPDYGLLNGDPSMVATDLPPKIVGFGIATLITGLIGAVFLKNPAALEMINGSLRPDNGLVVPEVI